MQPGATGGGGEHVAKGFAGQEPGGGELPQSERGPIKMHNGCVWWHPPAQPQASSGRNAAMNSAMTPPSSEIRAGPARTAAPPSTA
jgi:hypothetical protein